MAAEQKHVNEKCFFLNQRVKVIAGNSYFQRILMYIDLDIQKIYLKDNLKLNENFRRTTLLSLYVLRNMAVLRHSMATIATKLYKPCMHVS